MFSHMTLKVEARHMLGTTHITYESLVIEMNSSNMSSYMFISLESCTTVVTGIVPEFTVSAYVILVGTFVVVCFLAHLADKTTFVGVDDHVVAEGFSSLESLVAVRAHVTPLVGVHLHVTLEVLLGRGFIHTLGALVATWCPVLEHAVYIEAYLLGENLATVVTSVFPVPGCNAKVHVIEVLIKFFLSAEH